MYKKHLNKLSMKLAVLFILLCVNTAYCEVLNVSSLPDNSQVTTHPVVINLDGQKYVENIWLEDVSSGKVQAAADVAFIANVIKLNQTGTAADVLSTWNPTERENMGKYINDPSIFAANQNWYKTVISSAPLAKVFYGEFTIFIVQHTLSDSSNVSSLYPCILIGGIYYNTNLLMDDPIFNKYIAKIKDQIVFKTKPK